MNGTNQSKVVVTLRNPLDFADQITYTIIPHDNPLAQDWIIALKELLQSNCLLEKNFCFMGFPNTPRNLELLCKELNDAVFQINTFNSTLSWINAGLESYIIEEYFTPDTVRFGEEYPIGQRFDDHSTHLIEHLGLLQKKEILNKLHNHFEILQGTVDNLSLYYKLADYNTKYAIRQLNVLCHEIETLILSQQKQAYVPQWARPSQITTWLHAKRYKLEDQHKELFNQNGYNREFGHVYMHWAQIGKTLFEVFRDEGAPKLDSTVCEAITHLEYYSGEFDIEWAADMCYSDPNTPWHTEQQDAFNKWLIKNNLDPKNTALSLGYLPLGQIDLLGSFGTTDMFNIWNQLSTHLDIYKITIDDVSQTFEYCWSDCDYKQMQINMMRPGYDFSSRR
jgi:hypothetical protein